MTTGADREGNPAPGVDHPAQRSAELIRAVETGEPVSPEQAIGICQSDQELGLHPGSRQRLAERKPNADLRFGADLTRKADVKRIDAMAESVLNLPTLPRPLTERKDRVSADTLGRQRRT